MLRLALASALSRVSPIALWLIICVVYGVAALETCVTMTHAFDNGQWGSVDPATRQWFKSLKNSRGESCCDFADGVRLEDPVWRELADHSYEVYARDKWNQIPPDRVLTGSNKVGYAILWWPPSQEKPTCFLPGSKG